MKVFVAGATGVLGRRAVAELVGPGHQVTGLARSEEKADLLRLLGATPVQVDLFDPAAVKEAVAGHEVVVNLATHIPPISRAALPGAWNENARIRTEGARNLVDAALAAGAARYIQESIAFMYEDRGAEWLDEDTPVMTVKLVEPNLAAEAQAARVTEAGAVGVVLRFGQFYAADSSHTTDQARMARLGLAPTVGDPDAYTSWIHADDAATAVVAALTAPAGIYNVTDDEPVTRREHAEIVAAALGTRKARFAPSVVTRAGGPSGSLLTRSQRVSNRRFKDATGWAPAYPTSREGWAVEAADLAAPPADRRVTIARVVLGLLAVSGLVLGLWALLDPQGFYDAFPGGGRAWVSADGPYNEHLLRDFGGLNLGLAFVLGAAALRFTPRLARIAAVAALLFAVPHLAYHLNHLDVYETSDQVGNVVSLGMAVAGPLLVIGLLARGREAGAAS